MAFVKFASNLSAMIALHRRLAKAALEDAADVVIKEAKKNVSGGFRSGDFSAGLLEDAITKGAVRGVFNPRIRVGAPKIENHPTGGSPEYPKFWEIGHKNKYTGQFEQEPWLTPAMKETMEKQKRAAAKAVQDEVKDSPHFDPSFSISRNTPL